MLDTSNEVDWQKITNENNISLSRDTNDLFPSVIVETSDKHNISLMIEEEETPQKNTGNLKDYALFLLNYEIQSKNDKQIEK